MGQKQSDQSKLYGSFYRIRIHVRSPSKFCVQPIIDIIRIIIVASGTEQIPNSVTEGGAV